MTHERSESWAGSSEQARSLPSRRTGGGKLPSMSIGRDGRCRPMLSRRLNQCSGYAPPTPSVVVRTGGSRPKSAVPTAICASPKRPFVGRPPTSAKDGERTLTLRPEADVPPPTRCRRKSRNRRIPKAVVEQRMLVAAGPCELRKSKPPAAVAICYLRYLLLVNNWCAAAMLLERPVGGQATQKDVEHRRQEQAERSDTDHA